MSDRATYKTFTLKRKIHETKLYNAYHSAYRSILGKVHNSLSLPALETIEATFRSNASSPALECFKAGVLHGLNEAEQKLGRPLPIILTKSAPVRKEVTRDDLLALGLPSDKVILERHGLKQIKTMSKSVMKDLEREFKQSVDLGEAQSKLVARIQKLEEQAAWKARRIAQTESTRLFNGGTVMGYEKSRVVKAKRWITNLMGNPRPWHRDAHNQEVPVDQPFQVHGEAMMYPGDSAGSASNVIHCYCGVTSVIGIPKGKPGAGKVPKEKPNYKYPGQTHFEVNQFGLKSTELLEELTDDEKAKKRFIYEPGDFEIIKPGDDLKNNEKESDNDSVD